MMRKVLKLVSYIKFYDLGAHVMLVELSDIRDKEQVIREGPWSFDTHLVMVNEVDGT